MTERSIEKRPHNIGLRFSRHYDGDSYENQREQFEKFLRDHHNAFQMHLITIEDIITFREMLNLHEINTGLAGSQTFQECYLQTMADFQNVTRWRFAALNGQNRLSAALSFMIGCNYDLQDWMLKPASIDPQQILDVHAVDEGDENLTKGYTIYGQLVGTIPQKQDLLAYIDRSRIRSKLTCGVRFNPSLEVRILSHNVTLMKQPSVSIILECLQNIRQKRAVDERMLSNTSMSAKCSQIVLIIRDEIIKSHHSCIAFHKLYRGMHSKPSASFNEKYPDYKSESEADGEFC